MENLNSSQRHQNTNPLSSNLLFIGFMGAGKSTVSAQLGQLLEVKTAEMDARIEEKEGMPTAEIFQRFGEDYFRNCESAMLAELQMQGPLIISCGGGIVLREQNVSLMKQGGRVILLTASPQTILDRVKDSTERPLLNGHMNTAYIQELMEKRQAKYEAAADFIISTDHKTVAEICEELIQTLNLHDQ